METLSRPAVVFRGFVDRRQAGRLLALELVERRVLGTEVEKRVVVGLARGGVEVAAEVAAVLHAPLDALAIRKVGHPWQPEYGIGAVAPGGVEYVRAHDGLSDSELDDAVRVAAAKAAALDATLHERYPPLPLEGTACILVDDGLATGATMVAAVRWAHAGGAERVVVAVPVGAAETVRNLPRTASVDALVCLAARRDFGAVGAWYDDFHEVSDTDVVELLAASRGDEPATAETTIAIGDVPVRANVTIPAQALGWVVFAHGSGSGRRSPRNVSVARALNRAGMATLLFDLLTDDEAADRRNVFDVELLARRLVAATRWLLARSEADGLPLAYFGASTGAAAALLAAAELSDRVAAVVSRGGRPDLVWHRLAEVRAPTLLIVGGADRVVLELNQDAAAHLECEHEIAIVPNATHLFEEPGALEQVAELASAWLRRHFEAFARNARRDGGSVEDTSSRRGERSASR